MAESILRVDYAKVKAACDADYTSTRSGNAILEIVKVSLDFLITQCTAIDLVSKVPGKEYFTYSKNGVVARPANKGLFLPDRKAIEDLWQKWLNNQLRTDMEFAKLSYTVALAPCLAMELFDRQNKKGPATYFECYIGYLFARTLGVKPTKRVRLNVEGASVLMTMDFLFDLGGSHRKIHLPVKMSTRERVVQAWAHQRMLDAAYDNSYRGILILFSETKLDSRSHEVVEICVPDQWLAYQTLLARMDRVYYFDVPNRYAALTEKYPEVITIKQFGQFFIEKTAVLYS